eukprot:gene192-341_t
MGAEASVSGDVVINAIKSGDLAIISKLIQTHPQLINDEIDESDETAIMIAAEKGDAIIAAELLLKSLEMDVINDKLRAWCTRFPAILKKRNCMYSMLSTFDPFKESDGVF